MEDLVDIQGKNNNTIFYKKENDKCTFMICDDEENYVYIKNLKEEENNIKNEVEEKTINKKEEKNNRKDNKSKKIEIEVLE